MLLGKGAERKRSTRVATLTIASFRRHEEVVTWLVEDGADINVICSTDDSASQAALASGHENVVNALFVTGTFLNLDEKGCKI